MKKLIINPHHCSREELQELKDYLELNSWDYKEVEDTRTLLKTIYK